MIKAKDLQRTFKSDSVAEYQAPNGSRWRYEKQFSRAGEEVSPGQFQWHVLTKNDHAAAKRKIVEIHNREYI